MEISLKGSVLVIDGKEVDIEKSSFVYKDKELPKTWEELKEVQGYYVDNYSVACIFFGDTIGDNKGTFSTEEQAKASIALAQLSQLMKVYNGDWLPDWSKNDNKYVIRYFEGKICKEIFSFFGCFLAFKTAELRDEFLKNFEQLIIEAKPLL